MVAFRRILKHSAASTCARRAIRRPAVNPVGAGGEAERHAVLENRARPALAHPPSMGPVGPGSQARARTASISACPARGPGPQDTPCPHVGVRGPIRAGPLKKVQDRVNDVLAYGHGADEVLQTDQLVD
jgi:hypothetical protein